MTTDDLYAEQAVNGAAMLGPGGHDGILALDPTDFLDPRNREIAVALKAMILRGEKPDFLTTHAELTHRGSRITVSHLADLAGLVPVADNGWYYAVIVREATRVRMVATMARRLSDLAANPSAAEDLDQVLAQHADKIAEIPLPLDADTSAVPTITDLFAKEFPKRWLVPGLLTRRERIVVTAAEGLGKSVTCTQFAVSLAAGLHPWTGHRIGEGYRVLLLDAENDAEQSQHRYRWVGDRVNDLGGVPGWGNRIFHQIRPEGFDIVGRDRAWLTRIVSQVSPDFMVLGPAYKIMGAAKTSDDAAILAFFAVLDEIRVKFDVALMIEAHTGHAMDEDQRSLRPFGSSVWMRWPEVGIGLRRNKELDRGLERATVVDLVHWRGSRGERDWPDQLNRGAEYELPWTPARREYWDQARKAAS